MENISEHMNGILISAIGSIVASGLVFLFNALYWLRKEEYKFYHSADASEPFQYNGHILTIHTVQLENHGRKEINNIECHVSIRNGGNISPPV